MPCPGRLSTCRTLVLGATHRMAALGMACVVCATACLDMHEPASGINLLPPVVKSSSLSRENELPGVLGWDDGLQSGRDSVVNGFVFPFSVAQGDTIRLFVTAQTES